MLQGRNTHRIVAVLAIAVCGVAPSAVYAQDDAGPNQGKVSFSAGLDITSAYFFRGIIQEDQGLITQTWLDATFNLSDTVDLTIGIWNSMHDRQTGFDGGAGEGFSNGAGPEWWYEADLYLGLSKAVSENCSVGLTYTAYTSPNDAFGTVHELAVSGSHDDSGAWDGSPLEGSGLQPSITIAFELDGQADGGSNEGTYLEIGIEPSFTLIDNQDQPVTLSIPITVGLSLDDYYEEDLSGTGAGPFDDANFGYLDIGAVLSTPLSSIPADYGQWEASVGLHYLLLSEATENANANGGDSEFILSLGISMGY